MRQEGRGARRGVAPSDQPVAEVLDHATGPRRAEADELLAILGEISGEQPVVWAGRIIGFGEYEYRYESGHGGRAPLLAFAPGPAKHTIYPRSACWPAVQPVIIAYECVPMLMM